MSRDLADAPRWTPPRWMNRSMSGMLRTPGIQRLVGRSTALLTFTGRTSGRQITTPVSYLERGGRIVVTGHHTRQWIRNIAANPRVELRLQGRVRSGTATVLDDPDAALDDFVAVLEAQPAVARLSDVAIDDAGHADRAAAREVLDYTRVVSIELDG